MENLLKSVVTELTEPKPENPKLNPVDVYTILIKTAEEKIINSGREVIREKNDFMSLLYWQIANYIAKSNLDFEKPLSAQPWDYEKGILLMGNFGAGKTLLLKTLHKNALSFGFGGRYSMAYEIHEMFTDDKPKFNDFFNKSSNVFIDEIGDEPDKSQHFGNSESVIYRGLKNFFDAEEFKREKRRLFATTNLNARELISKYGERLYSRIVGNCNLVVFHGIDNRKL